MSSFAPRLRSQKVGGKDQFPFFNNLVTTVNDFLAHAKYGKKYEHLLKISEKYPDVKFYKLHSTSSTRFAAYFFLVLMAFLNQMMVNLVPKTIET